MCYVTPCKLIRIYQCYYQTKTDHIGPGGGKCVAKETVIGGRVVEMSAHSIQRCDWLSWCVRAKSANHSAESSGRTVRLLFLLSRSPCVWPWEMTNYMTQYIGKNDGGFSHLHIDIFWWCVTIVGPTRWEHVFQFVTQRSQFGPKATGIWSCVGHLCTNNEDLFLQL